MMRCRKWKVSSVPGKFPLLICAVSLAVMLSSSTALAEHLRILDSSGKTRSMVELAQGSLATVIVSLKEDPAGATDWSKVSASLIDNTTNKTVVEASADAIGTVVFRDVPTGSFNVAVSGGALSVSSVGIRRDTARNAAQTDASSSNKKRQRARAMYIGGASAVAGGVGIALGSSGSGSSSSAQSGSAFVDVNSGVRQSGEGRIAGPFSEPSSSGATTGNNTTPAVPTPQDPPSTITPINPPGTTTGDPNQGAGGTGNTEPDVTAPPPSPPPPGSPS